MTDLTPLLLQWNSGDSSARESLLDHVYEELTAIAKRFLVGERKPVELQPRTLVHEAYLRLIDLNRVDWVDRAHFLEIAARIMRQILIDDARKRLAQKRDGGTMVTLSGVAAPTDRVRTDVLVLHRALEELSRVDPQRARLVALRFFSGMTIAEPAEVPGSSPATVKRNWEVARGWLYRKLNYGPKLRRTGT